MHDFLTHNSPHQIIRPITLSDSFLNSADNADSDEQWQHNRKQPKGIRKKGRVRKKERREEEKGDERGEVGRVQTSQVREKEKGKGELMIL